MRLFYFSCQHNVHTTYNHRSTKSMNGKFVEKNISFQGLDFAPSLKTSLKTTVGGKNYFEGTII